MNRRLVQLMREPELKKREFEDLQNSLYELVWGKLFPPQILTDGLSNTVSDSVITNPGAEIPDCMTCGACCAAFVAVDAEDANIQEDRLWIVSTGEPGKESTRRFIRRRENDFACTALKGSVGEHVRCSVYEDRPGMCRTFEAGSDRCHAVRRAFGIEAFLTIEEMLEAKRRMS